MTQWSRKDMCSLTVYLGNATHHLACLPLFSHRPCGCLYFNYLLNLSPLSCVQSGCSERKSWVLCSLNGQYSAFNPCIKKLFAFFECMWWSRSNPSSSKVCISLLLYSAPSAWNDSPFLCINESFFTIQLRHGFLWRVILYLSNFPLSVPQ